MTDFNAALMQRYDGLGPRYTSYPTANHFHPGFSQADYCDAAKGSEGALLLKPLALYLHIPYCRSPCYYCACTKIVSRRPEVAYAYALRLAREISIRGPLFNRRRTVEQMHWGGGTPTYLSDSDIGTLMGVLDAEFSLSSLPDRDFSIEIDPRTANQTRLKNLRALGFNRVSFGVQDFAPQVQTVINRVQPLADVERLLGEARDLSYRSINFDLIYGLPLQTEASFEKTLDEVIRLRPDRVAVYGYAHMPAMFKAQRRFSDDDLPDAALRLRLLESAVRKLGAAGYVYIGMDHFALPDDSLSRALTVGTLQRSFQGYTGHADCDLVAFGASAIGRVGRLSIQNHKNVESYTAQVDAGELPLSRGIFIDDDSLMRGEVIQQLMCRGLIDAHSFELRYGVNFWIFFADVLPRLIRLQDDGLVVLEGGGIRLTPAGRYLMRAVAMCFDQFVTHTRATPTGSRVI